MFSLELRNVSLELRNAIFSGGGGRATGDVQGRRQQRRRGGEHFHDFHDFTIFTTFTIFINLYRDTPPTLCTESPYLEVKHTPLISTVYFN